MKQSTKNGIDAHVAQGRRVGDFLTAVLSNDLKGAFMLADHENRCDLFEIVCYCYNEIPSPCWGSPENVHAWREKHAHARALAANPLAQILIDGARAITESTS